MNEASFIDLSHIPHSQRFIHFRARTRTNHVVHRSHDSQESIRGISSNQGRNRSGLAKPRHTSNQAVEITRRSASCEVKVRKSLSKEKKHEHKLGRRSSLIFQKINLIAICQDEARSVRFWDIRSGCEIGLREAAMIDRVLTVALRF